MELFSARRKEKGEKKNDGTVQNCTALRWSHNRRFTEKLCRCIVRSSSYLTPFPPLLPSTFSNSHRLTNYYSQIRQVPDHQEVYLDEDGYSSVVIEILEYVNKESDEEALQEHFADLVRDTGDSTTLLEQETGRMEREGVK